MVESATDGHHLSCRLVWLDRASEDQISSYAPTVAAAGGKGATSCLAVLELVYLLFHPHRPIALPQTDPSRLRQRSRRPIQDTPGIAHL